MVAPGQVGWPQRIVWYDLQFNPAGSAMPKATVDQIHKAFEEATAKYGAGNNLQFKPAVTTEQKGDAAIRGIVLRKGTWEGARAANQAAKVDMSFFPGDPNVLPIKNAVITYDFDNSNIYKPVFGTTEQNRALLNYVLKVTLHEITHTMGLDHPKPQPCSGMTKGLTTMNDGCGLHDSEGYVPMTIQPCDQQKVTHGPPAESCCKTPGTGRSGGPIGGVGPGQDESCRAYLPTLEDCHKICTGREFYVRPDGCGGSWGDWCADLYPDIYPNGEVVCAVNTRVRLLENMSIELEVLTGRYKDDGNGGCYWEPMDSGPNQCEPPPPPTGRWKDDGYGGCYWDPNDSGPDQCEQEAGIGIGGMSDGQFFALVFALLIGRLGLRNVSRSKRGKRPEPALN